MPATRYLLDTDIVSDLIRSPQGRIAAYIAEIGEALYQRRQFLTRVGFPISA
jgi:predicted nucleic acid-binding protein